MPAEQLHGNKPASAALALGGALLERAWARADSRPAVSCLCRRG
jgi:hypothetical protein